MRRATPRRASADLRCAFALGQRHSYERLTYYINDAESAPALCVHALQSGIEERYTLAMIRERKLHPPGGRTAPETWPFSVRVHTLDGFALRCDGKAVRAHGKAQQRPLGLLKALIALGGHAVPEAQLAEALWPAADGDAARQSLTAALHRLRKLLGLDAAIRLHDRQLTLDSRYVWVDAWAFEWLIEQAEHEGDPARAKAAIEDACGHYRAPFLSADAEPWALAMRERLRAKLLRAVERLGHQLEREQQWDAALHWYQRGVDTDPLAETLYRRQMACYDALRRPAEALATYGRCEAALGTLEIPPSAETRALSDRIRTSARNRLASVSRAPLTCAREQKISTAAVVHRARLPISGQPRRPERRGRERATRAPGVSLHRRARTDPEIRGRHHREAR